MYFAIDLLKHGEDLKYVNKGAKAKKPREKSTKARFTRGLAKRMEMERERDRIDLERQRLRDIMLKRLSNEKDLVTPYFKEIEVKLEFEPEEGATNVPSLAFEDGKFIMTLYVDSETLLLKTHGLDPFFDPTVYETWIQRSCQHVYDMKMMKYHFHQGFQTYLEAL